MFKARSVAPLPAKVSGAGADWPADGRVKAIVKVSLEGHVPAGVALRSRIDGTMFTCEFNVADLARIADDPAVTAISAAQPVQAAAAKTSTRAAKPARPARRSAA
jgi:hypothetical protein